MRKQDMTYDIYCGIDIGKNEHYLVALEPVSDRRVMSRPLPQDEKEIEKALFQLESLGKVLVVVDQVGTIGRLVVAVAQRMSIDIAHMPPRTFSKAASTYGELKTDAFDAFVIADSARSTPRMIEMVVSRNVAIEEMRVLASFRADAVKERTACYNHLHDLLHKVSPPLEKLFQGEALHADLALRLLAQYGGPLGLKKAGKSRVSTWAGKLKYHKTRGPAKVEEIFKAISEMTLVLPASAVLEEGIKRIAARTIELEALEETFNSEIALLEVSIPEVALLKSMPGMGDVLAPAIASEIGDINRFRSAGHLASYGGVAPVKKESGTSSKGARKAKGGNRKLKNALVQYAKSACMHDPHAKAYYDKKRAQGKSHSQSLLALARRRVEVIYALLKNGCLYEGLLKAA